MLFFVPRPFDEKGRDLVFAPPWVFRPYRSRYLVGATPPTVLYQFLFQEFMVYSNTNFRPVHNTKWFGHYNLYKAIYFSVFCLAIKFFDICKRLVNASSFFLDTCLSLHLQFFAKHLELLHNCHNCLLLIQCFSADLILPYHYRHHTVLFPTGLR